MPTPVSSARQCLAAEAAAALNDAVAVARSRQHAQTTSLHVVFALLSSSSPSPSNSNSNSAATCPSPLLRDAVSRARSSGYSPKLQFKALAFCFGVALDRLPSSSISSSSSSCSSSADEPPVSNSLMAAIKRSQANQRRHPDTFHFYQQQQQQQLHNSSPSSSSSSSFSGVKVELQQLILAILDDPVVSRVFGEAGFRSSDIKLAVLRPPPPILRFPRATRCPPLFLCNFSAGDDLESVNLTPRGFSFPFSAGGDENCRRIGEIMARKSSRNPMLVGVGAGYAARDFAGALQRRSCGVLPPEISNLKFVSLERDVAESTGSSWIKTRLDELGRTAKEGAGVALGIGDLKGLVDLGDEVVDCLVSEMTRVLEECRGRLWVIGWSATYETYMKFLSRYPTLDKDWDLQLQLITSAAGPAAGGLVSRQPSLMESFVPFGGFFPTAYESNVPVMKPSSPSPRCQLCNDEYEQELAAILKGCAPSCEDQRQTKLPSWLQSVDMVRMNNPLDAPKIKDDKVLDARVVDLQKKWNGHCQRLHKKKPDTNEHPVFPSIIGLPCISDKNISTNLSITSPSITQSLSGLSSAFPVTVGLQTMASASHSISLPIVSEPVNKDLISKLQVGLSTQKEGLGSHHSALSDSSTHEDSGSPASVTSVTTDLVLGTLREPSCNELAWLSPSKKANEAREHQFLSTPKACLSSSNVSSKLDLSNPKAFYSSFLEKVCRQSAAIRAVSLAIVRCREHERHRGASLKGDIWLGFLGPDRFGKKKAATALAELMFGSRQNMICIDLGCQDSIPSRNSICNQYEIGKFYASSRGQTLADQIAGEISRKPSSVVFLENVEKADCQVQHSLAQAIRTGKICVSTQLSSRPHLASSSSSSSSSIFCNTSTELTQPPVTRTEIARMHAPSVLLAALAGTAIAAPAHELFSRQCSATGSYNNIAAYAQLPDPFKFYDGKAVASKADWECRKAEMSALMQKFELGNFPAPGTTTATMSGSSMSITVKVGSNTKTISVSITKPSGGGASGGPAIIGIGGISVPVPAGVGRINFGNDACAAQASPSSHGTGWFFDLHGRSHNAGATTAWAWCVGRIIDGLEQLGPATTGIDTKKLGATGCSRNGKGAFMVGALEKRIALTIPQESGSGGAASWRVSDSEKSKGKNIQTAKQIVGENAWFSPDFNQHTSKIPTVPEDHHFLAAMIAPRGLFVVENDIDWLGPVSTTVAMKAGRLIYDALGAKANMGFSLVGGHSHCQFPSASNANLNSYISKFLQGGTAETNNVETSKASVDMSSWVSQWSTPPAALKG